MQAEQGKVASLAASHEQAAADAAAAADVGARLAAAQAKLDAAAREAEQQQARYQSSARPLWKLNT